MPTIQRYDWILRCSIPIILSMQDKNFFRDTWIGLKARIYFSLLYSLPRYTESLENRVGSDFVIPRPTLMLAQICCIAIDYMQSCCRSVTNAPLFQLKTGFLSAKASPTPHGSSSPNGLRATFAGGKTP